MGRLYPLGTSLGPEESGSIVCYAQVEEVHAGSRGRGLRLEGTQVQQLKLPSRGTFPELEWFLPALPALLRHCTTELYNCIFVSVGS